MNENIHPKLNESINEITKYLQEDNLELKTSQNILELGENIIAIQSAKILNKIRSIKINPKGQKNVIGRDLKDYINSLKAYKNIVDNSHLLTINRSQPGILTRLFGESIVNIPAKEQN